MNMKYNKRNRSEAMRILREVDGVHMVNRNCNVSVKHDQRELVSMSNILVLNDCMMGI